MIAAVSTTKKKTARVTLAGDRAVLSNNEVRRPLMSTPILAQERADLRDEPEPTVIEAGSIPTRENDLADLARGVTAPLDMEVVKYPDSPAQATLTVRGWAECAVLDRADVLAGIAVFVRAERLMRYANLAASIETELAETPPAPRTDEEVFAEAEAFMGRLDAAQSRAATWTPAEAEIAQLRRTLAAARDVLAEVEGRIAELEQEDGK
jgi:uncharacterized protein (DUF3084 family)